MRWIAATERINASYVDLTVSQNLHMMTAVVRRWKSVDRVDSSLASTIARIRVSTNGGVIGSNTGCHGGVPQWLRLRDGTPRSSFALRGSLQTDLTRKKGAVIRLDYSISPVWYAVTAPRIDFASLTEFELNGDVFYGKAIIVVDDIGLSWRVDLPMLDFARSLFMSSIELSPLEPDDYVRTVDYNQRLHLTLLREREVLLSPSYSSAEAVCDLDELIGSAASFGLRVYTDFISAYPEARRSGILDEWYPVAAMQDRRLVK